VIDEGRGLLELQYSIEVSTEVSTEVSIEAPFEVLGMFSSIIAILAQGKISKQRLTVSIIYCNFRMDSAG